LKCAALLFRLMDRPLNKDTAAMWSLLALTVLSQVGLAQGLVLATQRFAPSGIWIIMATSSMALIWAASRSWSLELQDVFAWKRTSAAWLGITLSVGGLFALAVRLTLGEVRPVPSDALIMATTAGPLLEELLFRGFLWGVLRDMIKPHTAPLTASVIVAVVASVLFALAHQNASVGYFWLRLGAGLLHGFIRSLSGSSCIPAAASHWAYNVVLVS
jgi:membrane protease YdiL (CAAX protease family)